MLKVHVHVNIYMEAEGWDDVNYSIALLIIY